MSTETKENPNLSKDAEKIMEMVEKMNALDLSSLVKALEEKFNVTANAPMMVAGATAAGDTAATEPEAEKSAYDVVLKDAGDKKIAVIKVVRELDQSLGLVDAKNLVDKGEAVILKGAKKEEAEEAKKKIEEAGGKAELK